MIARLKQPGLIWSLLLCLVLVNGLMAAPSVAHAEHHANHEAGTHSTGLCAWLCAAGQSSETASVQLTSSLKCVDAVASRSIDRMPSPLPTFICFRGPPPLSL